MAEQNVVYTSPIGYNYTYVLSFEEPFLSNEHRLLKKEWMAEHRHYVYYMSAAYLLGILLTQYLMKNRKPFDLKTALVLWNAMLAVFSILGAIRSIPELYFILNKQGFKYSICVETYSYGVTGCWSWLFILSKAVELIDTLFLTLRKRKVIFLHWYHHLTVFFYVWFAMVEFPANARWFATMNYSIHAFMYTYYTIAAMRIIYIPQIVSMVITCAQIVQMIIGVYVNYEVYQILSKGEACDNSFRNLYMCFAMYASYFCLFFKFFLDRYFAKSSSSSTKTAGKVDKKQD